MLNAFFHTDDLRRFCDVDDDDDDDVIDFLHSSSSVGVNNSSASSAGDDGRGDTFSLTSTGDGGITDGTRDTDLMGLLDSSGMFYSTHPRFHVGVWGIEHILL